MAKKVKTATQEMIAETDKVLDYALSNDEKSLCANVVVFGPEFLRQTKGWKARAIKDFLNRGEVTREITALKKQYEDRTGIQERTQFFAQLKINSMVPTALVVIANCLRGARRNEETGEVSHPPTAQQFDAAVEVLDRANVQGKKFGTNDGTPSIDARAINIAIGSAPEGVDTLDAESRERVRLILNSTMNRARALIGTEIPAEKRRGILAKRLKNAVRVEDDEGSDSDG